MKALLMVVLFFIAAMMSSCASVRAPGPEPDLASQYIYAVEQQAKKRATTVYWVHPPSNEEIAKKLEREYDAELDSDG